jgi:oligopeptide transport system permease protein
MERIEKDMFEHVGKNLAEAQSIKRPTMSYMQDAVRRIKKNKPAVISFFILVVLIVMSLIGPIISNQLYGHTYDKQDLAKQNQSTIVSNQRAVKLNANKVFTYSKYKPNLRKTELSFKDVKLTGKGGKIAFIVGDKAEASFQGDEKEYNLEVTIKADETMEAVVKKLNDESAKMLAKDPDFRGVAFKLSGDNLKVEAEGDKRFNSKYWFGTDQFGRDQFTRLWEGGRVSFLIAFIAVFVTMVVGVFYGGVAGYFGGVVDNLMMRAVEVLMVVPDLLYMILLMTIFQARGLGTIIIVLAGTGWMGTARLVRGEVLRLKNSEYVMAAEILGASSNRIILKHLIPNAMGPIIVNMTMMIPRMIFSEAFLSFLGLGVPAPFASWGSLVNDGAKVFMYFPNQLIVPAIALSLTMLAFNMFGDGLRDALDPKLRK